MIHFLIFYFSYHWPINDFLVELCKFLSDDWDGVGESIEWNLREKVVFCLELHASHQDDPEKVCLFVVSACDYLMLDKRVIDLLIVPVFPFMISDQNKS